MELARAIGGFSIGVAAQPAGHPNSSDLATDHDHQAAKLALADFGVTQFFFEADEYTSLVDDLAARGVTEPVLPGIMPVTSLTSVPRMAAMGAAVPMWMVGRLEAADAAGGAEAVRTRAWSCHRAVDELLAAGCRACTSTRSTGRAQPERSTPLWGWRRAERGFGRSRRTSAGQQAGQTASRVAPATDGSHEPMPSRSSVTPAAT